MNVCHYLGHVWVLLLQLIEEYKGIGITVYLGGIRG